MNRVHVVVGLIVRSNHKILISKRKKHLFQGCLWEFPGGKLEEGETREEALVREIDEELEMVISNIEFALTVVHEYKDFELTMHTYKVSTTQTKFKLHAHKEAIWTPLEKLNKYDWAAADLPIVEYLQN